MRLHGLQYLRAAAALAVVYSHAAAQVPELARALPQTGAFGVDVFFVISGFIMVWIARPEDTPARFIVNRVRRVVPLYWFFTLLMAAILLVAPSLFRNSVFDPAALALSLAFWPYESAAHPGELWPLVAPGWSLNYEMYFYALFALSLFAPARLRVPVVIGAIALVWALAHAVPGDAPPLVFHREAVVFEFAFGMLLAVAWRRGYTVPPIAGAALLVVGTVWLVLGPPLPHVLALSVPALAVVAGTLAIPAPRVGWGTLLGDASYALYLSHIFVLGAANRLIAAPVTAALGDGPLGAWTYVVLACAACTAVGVVVHLTIDGWLLRAERLGGLRPRAPGRLQGGIEGPAPTAGEPVGEPARDPADALAGRDDTSGDRAAIGR